MDDLAGRLGRLWVVLITGSIAAACLTVLSILIQRAIPPTAPGIVPMELAFTKERLMHILNQWGEAGLTVYLKTMWIDYIYALSYSFFLASLFVLSSRDEKDDTGRLNLLFFSFPFIAAILDWVENSFHLVYFRNLQHVSETVVFAVSFISLIKWLLAIFVIVSILYNFLRKVFVKMKQT